MVMAYNTNAGAGLASGVDKLANAFLQKRRNEGLASGLSQIQGGDWEGGVNTIAETDPNTALGLVQYKQKQDDAMNMAQMKIAADIQNRNTLTPYQQEMLALKRQQLAQNGGGTGSIKNIEYLVGQGYTPEQAANMVFSGQNPAVQGLGQKGMEAYDKKIAEQEAERRRTADLLGRTQQTYDEMFKKGGLIEKAEIGADLPDTFEGRAQGYAKRAIPTGLLNKEAQQARQQLQYILGGLRLDESAAMKGALSDSEQKFLSDMVAGNVRGYSPWEIQGAMNGIIGKMQKIVNQGMQPQSETVIEASEYFK